MKRIVIFASGSGSNAENIINYFKDHNSVTVSLLLSNKKEAAVLDRANRLKVPAMSFNRKAFEAGIVTSLLQNLSPDLIVLAGFLWKVPEDMVKAFPGKIVNIHPALLPKFGGKGMYGMFVHQAVIENKEKESGITIHYVNEHYDEGAVIFQQSTPVAETDTAEDVAAKVHELEYAHFPVIIDQLLHAE
ncbi:phosphoribosylglycinamide formyltransferase [Robertkochia solimangrovi]|uniref:phosphoribosylglycinamide formyltransferase n=1 Tax=Robertkochia solimangrovi TaxID=2213046 RepID=UPI0011815959|nr:phosphoribosylglycinamide formyltransferase [Robertkochia solimangrovi]TRZ46272.1 phosphoribosylglycinamide formyltransferase [Robertkochia solimangrovi]